MKGGQVQDPKFTTSMRPALEVQTYIDQVQDSVLRSKLSCEQLLQSRFMDMLKDFKLITRDIYICDHPYQANSHFKLIWSGTCSSPPYIQNFFWLPLGKPQNKFLILLAGPLRRGGGVKGPGHRSEGGRVGKEGQD